MTFNKKTYSYNIVIICVWNYLQKYVSNVKEGNKMLKITLECPKCGARGHIRTRVKTHDRICAYCGYVGRPEEFEVKPNEPKE